MSTSVSTISHEEIPDEKLSSTSVESYAPSPHANLHAEGSWLRRAVEEVRFMFTTREGLIGDYESVFPQRYPTLYITRVVREVA